MDRLALKYARVVVGSKASGKTRLETDDEEEERYKYKALKNLEVMRIIGRAPAETEIRIRRLRWLQAIVKNKDDNRLIAVR